MKEERKIINIYRENCELKVTNFDKLPSYIPKTRETLMRVDRLKLPTTKTRVCVRCIYAEFDESVYNKHVTLSTTLVSKNGWNPKREVLSFNNNCIFENKIDYKPNPLVWYNLTQSKNADTIDIDIENSDVKLVKKLHIQLEVWIIEYIGRN